MSKELKFKSKPKLKLEPKHESNFESEYESELEDSGNLNSKISQLGEKNDEEK